MMVALMADKHRYVSLKERMDILSDHVPVVFAWTAFGAIATSGATYLAGIDKGTATVAVLGAGAGLCIGLFARSKGKPLARAIYALGVVFMFVGWLVLG